MASDGAELAASHAAYILVVEDELFVRLLISDALREAGYRVLEAFNGDEAIDILTSGAHVDVILSDVRMPGSVDGLGLLAFVRKNFPDLPVVISSGHLASTLAFEYGANEFLPKPYAVAHAVAVIKAQLESF
ncbi:MAG: response regulator [Sphingomonadales bacterium]|nr:response regulator [Sphingomonadales bacterium]